MTPEIREITLTSQFEVKQILLYSIPLEMYI